MSHELSVSIARRGAKVDLDMESAAFGVISIDGELIPAEERPGLRALLLLRRAGQGARNPQRQVPPHRRQGHGAHRHGR